MNVQQHRSRCIGNIGDMNFATAQLPHKPAVNCSKCQVAFFCFCSCAIYIIQYPFQFCGGKIGVNYQPCFLLDGFCMSCRFQLITIRGGSSILPDYGMINRFPGTSFPYHCSFTLIGDANAGYLLHFNPCLGNSFSHGTILGAPDLFCIMLYPARLRKYLFEFFLCNTGDVPMVIKNNTPAACSSLVECKNVMHLELV